MPLIVWLLLGGMAAYLIAKSGSAAAASSAIPALPQTTTITLSLSGPSEVPGPYVVPVESSLPSTFQNQLTSFFVDSDQPSFSPASVAALAQQLAENGYTIAAGSVMSAWQMIVSALNAYNAPSQASSSTCPPGYEPAPHDKFEITTLGEGTNCVPISSSAPFIGPPIPSTEPVVTVATTEEAEAPAAEFVQATPIPTLLKI
jgi:hypothetical protein